MSAVSALSSAAARDATNAFSSLTSADFIRVMFAELSRQDPTKPTDSKDLLQQLGAIRSIESDISLQRRLEEIARQNEITSAGSLVGAFVEGMTDAGVRTRGYVDSVSITRLGVSLNLSSGLSVPLSRVETVYDPALISTVPPPGASPPPGNGVEPPSGNESEGGAPSEGQAPEDQERRVVP